MSVGTALQTELSEGALGTRKVLERIPTDKFSWRPHNKSTTFGRLASHVDHLPSWVEAIVGMEELVPPAECAGSNECGSCEAVR